MDNINKFLYKIIYIYIYMSSGFTYKNTDLSNFLETGTVPAAGYNFNYATAAGNYDSLDSDSGIYNSFLRDSLPISNIKAKSVTLTSNGTITIPSFCDSFKIYTVTPMGNTGPAGATGQANRGAKGDTGAPTSGPVGFYGPTGQSGSTGQIGQGQQGGFRAAGPARFPTGSGGDGGEGGHGGDGSPGGPGGVGPGGPGGEGGLGPGGEGGEGGLGGPGIIAYTSKIYTFANINKNITCQFNADSIVVGSSNAAVGLTVNSGQTGQQGATGGPGQAGAKGATGGPGQAGGRGNTGAAGNRGQDGDKGWTGRGGNNNAHQELKGATGRKGDPGWSNNSPGNIGNAGASGGQGAEGQAGQPGAKGRKGDTGANGNSGTAISNTPLVNVYSTTHNTTNKFVTVYFFST